MLSHRRRDKFSKIAGMNARIAIDMAKLAEIRIVIPAKTNKIRLALKLTGSHTLVPSASNCCTSLHVCYTEREASCAALKILIKYPVSGSTDHSEYRHYDRQLRFRGLYTTS